MVSLLPGEASSRLSHVVDVAAGVFEPAQVDLVVVLDAVTADGGVCVKLVVKRTRTV